MRAVNDLIAAGRNAVRPRVRGYVMVSVSLDGEVADGRKSGVILAVELAGPGTGPRDSARMISVRQHIGVWRPDEIVPAACRVAEKILRTHPSWRRLPERS